CEVAQPIDYGNYEYSTSSTQMTASTPYSAPFVPKQPKASNLKILEMFSSQDGIRIRGVGVPNSRVRFRIF
ncbi:hypothetical protein COY25_04730, partial [Candidatus Uhrbacteria bacterium CG_4_10_14_0_2_um_filter_41_7]